MARGGGTKNLAKIKVRTFSPNQSAYLLFVTGVPLALMFLTGVSLALMFCQNLIFPDCLTPLKLVAQTNLTVTLAKVALIFGF